MWYVREMEGWKRKQMGETVRWNQEGCNPEPFQGSELPEDASEQ